MIVYKIRDANTGLFSTGGATPRFTTRGKTWGNIGHVHNHQRQYCIQVANRRGIDPFHLNWDEFIKLWPTNWHIVSFELVETGTVA